MAEGEKDKLVTLLNYWISHNSEHGDEFREWAEKLRGSGSGEVYAHILEAAQQMDKANQFLLKALEMLKAEQNT
jgi:hypothetical protein